MPNIKVMPWGIHWKNTKFAAVINKHDTVFLPVRNKNGGWPLL